MSRRTVLTDAQWEQSPDLLPSSGGCVGRPFRDHRQVVEGIVHRYHLGAHRLTRHEDHAVTVTHHASGLDPGVRLLRHVKAHLLTRLSTRRSAATRANDPVSEGSRWTTQPFPPHVVTGP